MENSFFAFLFYGEEHPRPKGKVECGCCISPAFYGEEHRV